MGLGKAIAWVGIATSFATVNYMDYSPVSWAILSFVLWLTYGFTRGWRAMSVWDKRQMGWGLISSIVFFDWLQIDKDFKVGSHPY